MTMIFNGTTGITFPDGQTQDVGVPDPGTNGNVLTSNGTAWVSSTPGTYSQWTTTGSDIYYNTGNVGIGTSSPASSAGYTALTLNNATNSGYVVLQTNGVTTSDWYVSGGTVATLRGVAVPLNLTATGANYISATTNGSERMRIDSSGNVQVGTTTSAGKVRFYQTADAPTLTLTSVQTGFLSSNQAVLNIVTTNSVSNPTTSSAISAAYNGNTLFYVRNDGLTNINTPARTSGTNYTALLLSDNVTGAQTVGFGTRIMGSSNGGNAISVIGFESGGGGANNDTQIAFYTQSTAGGLTRRVTIGYTGMLALEGGNANATGTGIAFPATQSASSDANTLDDYEEGTWTPVLRFNGSSTGITYVARYATYTKVGRVVTVIFYFQLGSKGSATGQAEISGFPFAFGSGISDVFNLMPARGYINTGGEDLYCYTSGNSTVGLLYQGVNDGTANGAVTQGAIANNSEFEASFSYFVS